MSSEAGEHCLFVGVLAILGESPCQITPVLFK